MAQAEQPPISKVQLLEEQVFKSLAKRRRQQGKPKITCLNKGN